MIGVVRVFGDHTLPGILCLLLAGTTLLAWQCLVLMRGAGRTRVLVAVRSIALSSAAVSVLLIVARFIAVERL